MMSGNYTSIDNQKVSGSVPAVSDPGHVTVKFADSTPRTFPPSEAQGKISGGSRPPRDADACNCYVEAFRHVSLFRKTILIILLDLSGNGKNTHTCLKFLKDEEKWELTTRIMLAVSYISLLEEDNCHNQLIVLCVGDTFLKPASGSDEAQQSGWFQTFTIAAYKPFFDVDTSDILDRIKDSLFPFRGTFNEKTASNPDFGVCFHLLVQSERICKNRIWKNTVVIGVRAARYGPFWICTTLIFVAASIGTFVTYVAHKLNNKDWNYDINLITWSAGVFYGYVIIVPLGLYVILKYFSVPSGLVQLFCLYGYSLFVFIPALCLSIVPLEIFRWVVAGVAGFMSATFVALNLRAHIKSAGERWFFIVAGIFLLQLALAVVLKLYLFTVTV
ncbi:hypothetical protein CJ030_MR7G009281 [Morella rubra]|uniref:Protein YIP n=1 Tax=Morella rubra TaxID=262757 RepID=A0A6A1V079_9ROSI|nr:hypothetical protein CJ030_MR7G009281 [Morella rubra]